MPSVQRILETALEVEDLDRSEAFYRSLFGFPVLLSIDRLRALGIGGQQVLLLFHRGASVEGGLVPGGFIPGHEARGTLHLALAIRPDEVEAWRRRLVEAGIVLESEVRPKQGGVSLYFRDPDQHLIELATPTIWGFGS